jgi:hypothetical protein
MKKKFYMPEVCILPSYVSVSDKYYFEFLELSYKALLEICATVCFMSSCCKQLILTVLNLNVSLITGLRSCWYITCILLECVVCS